MERDLLQPICMVSIRVKYETTQRPRSLDQLTAYTYSRARLVSFRYAIPRTQRVIVHNAR